MATAGLKTIDIITRALKKIGAIAVGEAPDAQEAQDGLDALNSMLGSWNTQRNIIYTITIAQYDLVSNQQTYTIGPGGDFDAPRPQSIETANLILNYLNPVVRVPMDLLNDQQWAAIRVQQIPNSIPQLLYNDGAYPLSTLYLWGFPSQNLQLELYTWQALSTFPSISTDVVLPPGYEEALVYNLAVRLAPDYERPVRPDVAAIAVSSLAVVKSLNSPDPLMIPDAAVLGTNVKNGFNYQTGEPY